MYHFEGIRTRYLTPVKDQISNKIINREEFILTNNAIQPI